MKVTPKCDKCDWEADEDIDLELGKTKYFSCPICFGVIGYTLETRTDHSTPSPCIWRNPWVLEYY